MQSGGRWHSRGRRVIYASATLSLAALEYLVHLGRRDSRLALVAIEITIPDALPVEAVERSALPPDWQTSPPTDATISVGNAWLDGRRGAVLKVPSAIISSEFNFLINPLHPHFQQIGAGTPRPFAFDGRLLV
jgi:RES domain-containing protein